MPSASRTSKWPPAGWAQAAEFNGDQEVQYFIELEGGGKPELGRIIKEKIFSPYTWRVRHFKVVQRVIGGDVIGTQGTPVEVMGRLIHHSFFPELWDVRNELTRMNLPE